MPAIRQCETVAESWFLKIDGIVGDSTDANHKDEIDVLSWSWGLTQTGGGGDRVVAVVRARPRSRTFTSWRGSARRRRSCSSLVPRGTHHKTAALSGVRSAGKEPVGEFLKYKLSDVVVTSDQHSGSEGDMPVEQFSLNYSKIEVTYTPQTSPGKVGVPIQAGFDVKANKKL